MSSAGKYLFRAKMPEWLNKRAMQCARAGNQTRGLKLVDLQYQVETWLRENLPEGIEPISTVS